MSINENISFDYQFDWVIKKESVKLINESSKKGEVVTIKNDSTNINSQSKK